MHLCNRVIIKSNFFSIYNRSHAIYAYLILTINSSNSDLNINQGMSIFTLDNFSVEVRIHIFNFLKKHTGNYTARKKKNVTVHKLTLLHNLVYMNGKSG